MPNRATVETAVIDDEDNDDDEATLQPAEAIQTILTTSPSPSHNERTLPRR